MRELPERADAVSLSEKFLDAEQRQKTRVLYGERRGEVIRKGDARAGELRSARGKSEDSVLRPEAGHPHASFA
jgi:hypothetical protein